MPNLLSNNIIISDSSGPRTAVCTHRFHRDSCFVDNALFELEDADYVSGLTQIGKIVSTPTSTPIFSLILFIY